IADRGRAHPTAISDRGYNLVKYAGWAVALTGQGDERLLFQEFWRRGMKRITPNRTRNKNCKIAWIRW
ncbi:MAG: hypothetical protein HY360_08850, partial [Verrucomicrobia bacterium]|nr:hypothetical protein [Verrucomicrobiota bacterium]